MKKTNVLFYSWTLQKFTDACADNVRSRKMAQKLKLIYPEYRTILLINNISMGYRSEYLPLSMKRGLLEMLDNLRENRIHEETIVITINRVGKISEHSE